MLEHYLLGTASGYEEVLSGAAAEAQEKVDVVLDRLRGQAPLPGERVADILAGVKTLQQRVGYAGDYRQWIQHVRLPPV
jgi:hypothetical protein